MGVGIGEIILIVAAVILVFGATQIPKIARALGEGLKEFRKAARESKEEDETTAVKKPKQKQIK